MRQKRGLPFGDPHALSCILHDNQILLIYMYPVGIRYANQDLNVPDKAVYNILAGLTKNLSDSLI